MRPTPREELAVVRAVVYASLFDYPLTLPQLRETLEVPVDQATLARWLAAGPLIRRALRQHGGFVFPRARPDLVERRRIREAVSRRQLRRDLPVLRAIASLPYVRMMAISGSLAHLNADEEADLDLFVITAPSRVWTVTVLALVLARIMGWRKRLCLNYVVSETALAVEPRDLFTANQIIHLQPVIGWSWYRAFLDANRFIASHYPNFLARPPLEAAGPPRRPRLATALEWMLRPLGSILEHGACALYQSHLRRRSGSWPSPEQVRLEPQCLKLHTHSHRDSVMQRFDAALAAALSGATPVDVPHRPPPAGAERPLATETRATPVGPRRRLAGSWAW